MATIDVLSPDRPLDPSELYGLLAEYETPGALLTAARGARMAEFKRIEAYTPFPVHGLTNALGQVPTKLPMLSLLGGALGAFSGYALQYWAMAINYPINVGGRPLHSWPAFLPVTFEMAVLGAAIFTVLGMLALNGLPMPYHPVFNVPQFKLASRDRFFLCIEAGDQRFDPVATREFLQATGAIQIYEVPR
jgi:hypothetical protein